MGFRLGRMELVLVLLLFSPSVILSVNRLRATILAKGTSTTLQITIATTTCRPIKFVLARASTMMALTYKFVTFVQSNVRMLKKKLILLMKLPFLVWKRENRCKLLGADNLYDMGIA